MSWEQLTLEERRDLLRNTFEDHEWVPLIEWIVDDGSIRYELQQSHHQIIETLGNIAGRLDAPFKEIRRYFAAWCDGKRHTEERIYGWKEVLFGKKWSFSTLLREDDEFVEFMSRYGVDIRLPDEHYIPKGDA